MNFSKIMRNFFKGFFLVITGFGMQEATQAQDKVLIVGCRPWDQYVQEIEGIKSADFLDFMIHGAPSSRPTNFHHIDFNDQGAFSEITEEYKGPLAGKLSTFASLHKEGYNVVIFDWFTWQHVRREQAWQDFRDLLTKEGFLIVPVTSVNFLKGPQSFEKARGIKGKLEGFFSRVEIKTFEETREMKGLSLLHCSRGELLEDALSFEPAIIIATK